MGLYYGPVTVNVLHIFKSIKSLFYIQNDSSIMSNSAIDVGTTDIVVSSKVYVFGSERFPNGANDFAFLVQVPVENVIQDGRVEYTMPRADNGTFTGIMPSLDNNTCAAIDSDGLKGIINSSECLLLAQGAYCDLRSQDTGYRAEFFQRSIQDKRIRDIWHVLLDSSGAAVDLGRKADQEGRIYVIITGDPFDKDLDVPIPESMDSPASWKRVISQVLVGDTGEQSVLAYSPDIGFIMHPSIEDCHIEIVHEITDATWVSYRHNGNSLDLLDSFPLYPVIHGNLRFDGTRPPKMPVRIGYNNRDYVYRYPAFESGQIPGSMTRHLLRLIASALMNGYPKDEGRELDIQDIFSNVDALKDNLASKIAFSVLEVINGMDWGSFINTVFTAAGPSRFSFSDMPSNLDVRGMHVAMNFEITFTHNAGRPYTIKDLAIVLLLS